MLPTQEYKFLRLVCLALLAGLLVFGLWPFNFFPRNRVEWQANGDGVHFYGHSQIYAIAPWKTEERSSPSANHSFSIEIWLKPDQLYSWGTILSIVDPSRPDNLRIDQSLTDLVLRGDFQDPTLQSGFRPVWAGEIFKQGQTRFVTITSGPQGTTVYLEAVRQERYSYVPVAGNLDGRLLIGHSASGGNAWAGTLLGLAIYDREFTPEEVGRHYQAWSENRAAELVKAEGILALYPFDERDGNLVRNHAGSMPDLIIPPRFHILHRRFLADPSTLRPSDLPDTVINILGFVPFGWFVAFYFSRALHLPRSKAIIWTVILGGMTSFLIEFLQAYLPTRDSSYLDLINNILGTALGSMLMERIPWAARYFTRANSIPDRV